MLLYHIISLNTMLKWFLLYLSLFIPITKAQSNIGPCNLFSQPYTSTDPSITDPYWRWDCSPNTESYPSGGGLTVYISKCQDARCPTLRTGFELLRSWYTGFYYWNQCYYCGDACNMNAGQPVCRQGYRPTSYDSSCRCVTCTMCNPGYYEPTGECSRGIWPYIAGLTSPSSSSCTNSGCDGHRYGGSWCRYNQRISCWYSPEDYVLPIVYNSDLGKSGTMHVLRYCSPYYPSVFGWCESCPEGRITTDRCSSYMSSIYSKVNGYNVFEYATNDPFQLYFSNMGGFSSHWTYYKRVLHAGQATCGSAALGSYVAADGRGVLCEKGYYCPDGWNKYTCPSYTYSNQGSQVCLSCEPCSSGTYMEISPMSTELMYGLAPCGKPASVQSWPLCKDCPVGRYCIWMTSTILNLIWKAYFQGGTMPSLGGPCSCSGGAGTFIMDIVNGCNPFQAKQFKPPVCLPCPSGKDCTNFINPVNCSVGTYGGITGSGKCIPCDTKPCESGSYRPPGQCTISGLADPTGIRPWDRCLKCTQCDAAILGPLRKCGTPSLL